MSEEKMKFYQELAPAAMEQQIKYGIPASVTLAQAWLEHGSYSASTNNYFGIHGDDKYWQSINGPTEIHQDAGKAVPFRVYATREQGLEDHSRFITVDNKRYSAAWSADSTDYRKWCQVLNDAGYAERDPSKPNRYSNSLVGLIEEKDYNLHQYDYEAVRLARERGATIGYMRGQPYTPTPSAPAQATGQQNAVGQGHQISAGMATGRYSLPVEGIDQLVVNSVYGHRHAPTAGASSDHKGIDLRTIDSSGRALNVLSMEDNGKVVAVGTQTGDNGKIVKGGHYVTVEYARADGTAYRVSYCHLAQPSQLKVGDVLMAGDRIGLSGSSGAATGVHLHLTIKKGVAGDSSSFQNINPANYLAEIVKRGNINTPVVLQGHQDDYLASYKAGIDVNTLQPTNGDLLAANSQQQQSPTAEDQTLMASNQQGQQKGFDFNTFNGFGTDWERLQYLIGLNGEDASMGGSGDIIGDLIGMCFKGFMAISALKLFSGASGTDMASKEDKPVSAEIDQKLVDKAKKETPDGVKMRDMSQLNYDSMAPQQEQSLQQVMQLRG